MPTNNKPFNVILVMDKATGETIKIKDYRFNSEYHEHIKHGKLKPIPGFKSSLKEEKGESVDLGSPFFTLKQEAKKLGMKVSNKTNKADVIAFLEENNFFL